MVNVVFNENNPTTNGTIQWQSPLASLTNHTYSGRYEQNVFSSNWAGGLKLTGWTLDGFSETSDGSVISYETPITLANFSTLSWGGTANLTGTINLYAQWTRNTYKIAYNLHDGSAEQVSGKSIQYGDNYTQNILAAPTREGYHFDGWYLSDTYNGNPLTESDVCDLDADNGATLTLHAKWTVCQVNITYVPNNGNANISENINYDNTSYTLKVVNRTGYHFDGWVNAANTNDTVRDLATLKLSSTETGGDNGPCPYSITLNAAWSVCDVKITYNANHGTVTEPNPITFTYAQLGDYVLPTPTRPGYTFDGWFNASNQKVTESNLANNLQAGNDDAPCPYSLALTAQWTARKYDLTFHANKPAVTSGSVVCNASCFGSTSAFDANGTYADENRTYTDESTVTVFGNNCIDLTLTGYKFLGWYPVQTVTQPSDTAGKRMYWNTPISAGNGITFPDGDGNGYIHLYAYWEAETYPITLYAEGGHFENNEESKNTYATYDSTYSFISGWSEAAWDADHSFIGWFTEGGVQKMGNLRYNGDETAVDKLYARWDIAAKVHSDGGTLVSDNCCDAISEVTAGSLYTIPVQNGQKVNKNLTNCGGDLRCIQKTGYSLVNWYWDNGTFQNVVNFNDNYPLNGELYAEWQALPVNVVFYDNKPTGPGARVGTVTWNSPLDEESLPDHTYTGGLYDRENLFTSNFNGANVLTLSGYTFEGFYKDAACTQMANYDESVDATNFDIEWNNGVGTIKLYAKWEPITCTLNLRANGNTVSPATVNGSDAPVTAYVKFDSAYRTAWIDDNINWLNHFNAERTGYEFAGWFNQEANGTEVLDEDTCSTIVAGGQSLYAYWTPRTFTCTLAVNGGTLTSGCNAITNNTFTVTYDKAINSGLEGCDWTSTTSMTRTGYTFAGWYTQDSTTTGSWGALADFTNPYRRLEDTTFYAKWTANRYTVRFDGNAPAGATVDPEYTLLQEKYDSNYRLPADPSCSGYDFIGWFTSKTGNVQVTGETLCATPEPHTLYARWREHTYTVVLKANGGNFNGIDGKDTIHVHIPYLSSFISLGGWKEFGVKRTHYDFVDWYTEPNGQGTKIEGGAYQWTKDTTLYAHWTDHYYKVTLNPNGAVENGYVGVLPNGCSSTSCEYSIKYGQTINQVANCDIRQAVIQPGGGYSPTWNVDPTLPWEYEENKTFTVTKWTVTNLTIYLNPQGGEFQNQPYTTNHEYSLDYLYGDRYIVTVENKVNKYGIMVPRDGYGWNWDNSNELNNHQLKDRTGYDKGGWRTVPYNGVGEPGGDPVDNGDQLKYEHSHTLYYCWLPRDVTVTFKPNTPGSTPVTLNQTSKTIKYDALYGELPTPECEGYTFQGWYLNTDGTGTEITSESICNQSNITWPSNVGSIDLFAKWTADTLLVKFKVNQPADAETTLAVDTALIVFDTRYEDIFDKNGVHYTTTPKLPTPVCTSNNYVFRGWYYKNNATNSDKEIVDTVKYRIPHDTTLYARWEKKITVDTVFQDSVSCNGFGDGKITVQNIRGGEGNFRVVITSEDNVMYDDTVTRNGSATTVVFEGTEQKPIRAGNWTVQIFDTDHPEGTSATTKTGADGCKLNPSCLVEVLEPKPLTFTATPSPQTCYNLGSIKIDVHGGNGYDTVKWVGSTGIASQAGARELQGEYDAVNDIWNATTTINSLLAQNVTIHVTDQKSCPVDDQMVTIGQPNEVVPTFDPVEATVCSGQEFILPENRPAGIRYSWDAPAGSGCTGTGTEIGDLMPSVSGVLNNTTTQQQVYTYTVTPYKGGVLCAGTPFTVKVTVGPSRSESPTVATVTSPAAGCADSTRIISVSFNREVSNVTYQIDGDFGNGNMELANATTYTYTKTITLPDTCRADIGFTVKADDDFGCNVQGEGVLHVRIAEWDIPASSLQQRPYPSYVCVREVPRPTAAQIPHIQDGCGNFCDTSFVKVQYKSNAVGSSWKNEPFSCGGLVQFTYRFTACDGTYKDWTFTDTVTGMTTDSVVVNNPITSIPAVVKGSNCNFQVPNLKTDFLSRIDSLSTCTNRNSVTFAQTPAAGEPLNDTIDVTVTLTDGCSRESHYTVTVTVPTMPTLKPIAHGEIVCYDSTTWAIVTVNAGTGTAPYGYQWSRGAEDTSDTIKNLKANSYTVTVTDANGCEAYGFVTLNEPSPIEATVHIDYDTVCSGEQLVVSATNVTGGTYPYQFHWNNGIADVQNSPIQTLTATNADTLYKYILYVTDAHNCHSKTDTDSVVVHALPVITVSGPAAVCPDSSATLIASGALAYLWDNVHLGDTNIVTPTQTTTYTVIGENEHGCLNTATHTVAVQSLPAVTIMNHPEAMAVDDTTLVGVRPLATNETVTWHIENRAGNTEGQVALVTPGVQDSVACTTTSVKIKGVAVGKVVVFATITDTTNLSACNSVTVYDTIKVQQSVITLTCPTPSQDSIIYTGTPDSIANTVTVETSAGEDITNACTWTYSIDGENFTDTIPTRTEVGSTQVTVKASHEQYESNTCQYTLTVNSRPVTIEVTDCVSWNGNPISTQIYGHYVVTAEDSTLLESDQIIGQVITSSAAGGVYTYDDDEEVNTASKTNVQVIRASQTANPQSVTANYDIKVRSTQTVMQMQLVSATGVTCNGKNNGEIEVTTTPDSNTYIYYIGGKDVDNNNIPVAAVTTYDQLVAGTYTLYATNAAGTCKTNTLTNVVVNDIDPIEILPADSVVDICAGEPVALTVESISGGSMVYTYEWRDTRNDVVVGNTATVLNVMTADTTLYKLTVRDYNDQECFATADFTVNVRPGFLTQIVADNQATHVCLNSTLGFSETLNTDNPHCHYKWATIGGENGMVIGDDTNSTANVRWSTAGTKQVTVTVTNDSTGCTSTGFYEVTVDTLPEITITSDRWNICLGEDSTTLAASAGEGYLYKWNDENESETRTVKVGVDGNYTVMVTDGNGCQNTATAAVGRYPLPEVQLNNGNTVLSICPGQETATLTATPVEQTYTYVWMRGEIILNSGTETTMTDVTATGSYRVKVIDSVGCYAVSNWVTLSHYPIPKVEVNNPSICESGIATLTANGAQNYTWSPTTYLETNNAVAYFSGAAAGTYTDTVRGTNAHGCWDTAVATITVVPDIKLTVNNEDLLTQKVCAGTPLDIIKIHVEHGTLELVGNLPYNVIFHGEMDPENANDTIDGITYQVGSFNYSVVATSDQTPRCTSKQLNGFIKVNPMVEISLTPAAQDVCAGGDIDTVEITCANGILPTSLNAPQGLTYLRIDDTKARLYGKVASLTTTTELTIPVEVASDQEDPTCDTLTENITLTVHPNPVVKIAELPDVCPAQETQEVTANLTTPTTGDYTYYWTGGVWIDPMTTVSDAESNTVRANVPTVCIDSFLLRVEVTDGFGCYAMDTTMMVVKDTAKPQLTPIHNPVTAKGIGNCKFEVINLRDSVIIADACTTGQYDFYQDVDPGTLFTADETQKVVNVWVEGRCNNSQLLPITVLKPAPVDVHITSADTVCKGSGTDMTAAATSGVAGNITYTWTPNTGLSGTTTAVVTASPAETTTYTVTARDGNGCIDTAKHTIHVYPLPVVTIDEVATLCPNAGYTTVTAHVDPNNGLGTTFYYHWTCEALNVNTTTDNGVENQQTITNIPNTCNSEYTLNLAVTENGMGCVATTSTVITVKDDVSPTIVPDSNHVWAVGANCRYTVPDLTSANVMSYTITDLCTQTFDQSNLTQSVPVGDSISAATPVTVTVTDPCGNTAETVVWVNIPDGFTVTENVDARHNVSCFGGNDGKIIIYVPGQNQGTPPYTYHIDGVENTSATPTTFTGLTAGTHHITVVDGIGCSASLDVEIEQPADTFKMIIETTPATCANNDGMVKITVNGGTPNANGKFGLDYIGQLEYSQVDTVFDQYSTSPAMISTLPVGKYRVTITDKNDCTIIDSFEITLNNNLVVESIPVPKPTCSGGSFATIPVNNTPGTTYYTWPEPDQSVANGVSGTDAAELADHKTAVSDEGLVNNTNEPVNLTYHVTAYNGVCTYTSDLVMTVTATVRPQVVMTTYENTVCPSLLTSPYNIKVDVANVYAENDTLTWNFNNDTTFMQTHTNPSPEYTEYGMVKIPSSICNKLYTYTVEYSDGVCASSKADTVRVRIPNHFTIDAPAITDTVVSCTRYIQEPHLVPSKWPSLITDGCGQVIDTFVNVSYPFLTDTTCNSEVVFVYTFRDCSGNDTTYKYTYHVVRGAMTLPANGADTVVCESDARMPASPGNWPDACNTNVSPEFPETFGGNPNPLRNVVDGSGTVTYTYTYTTCDGQVYPWRFVYTVIPEPFTPYDPVTVDLHCMSEMVATDSVPVPDTAICGTHIDFQLDNNYPQDDVNGNGCVTRTYRYDYRVNGTDYEWFYIENVVPENFADLMPENVSRTVACYSEINISNIPLPTVTDACGTVLEPVSLTPKVTPAESQWHKCNDMVRCTYTYKNCAGDSANWVYTWVVKDTLPPVFVSKPEVVPAHRTVDEFGNCAYAYPTLDDVPVFAENACPSVDAMLMITWNHQSDEGWGYWEYIEQNDEIQHLPVVVIAQGCSATAVDSFFVEVPAKLSVRENLSSHKNVTCYGGSNGEIRVTATGGTQAYTFSISEPSATQTQSGYFTGLPVPVDSLLGTDNYGGIWYGYDTVTVIDAHNCKAEVAVTVTSPVKLEWENCPDTVTLCADPGQNYCTVTFGPNGNVPDPNLSTLANVSSHTHMTYKPRYNVGPTSIRYSAVSATCRQLAVDTMVIYVLPNASVQDSAANMVQEVCPNTDIDPIVFTFANADSVTLTGTLPTNMVTYEKTQVTKYTTKTTVTISGNPQETDVVYDYTFTAYSPALPGSTLPCNEATYSGSITIHDTVAPTFVKPVDMETYLSAACTIDVDTAVMGVPTNISDNCANEFTVTYRDEEPVIDCGGAYHFNRVWRVVDPSGNVSKSDSIQLITVLDTVKPVISPDYPTEWTAIPNMYCNSDVPLIWETILNDYASDNCTAGVMTASQVPAEGTEILEDTDVEVTVFDACGNSASVTVHVTANGVMTVHIDSVDAGCYLAQNDGKVYFTILGSQLEYSAYLNGQSRIFQAGENVVDGLSYGDYSLVVLASMPNDQQLFCQTMKSFTIQPIPEMLTVTANSDEWEYDTEEHQNRTFTVKFGDNVITTDAATDSFVTLPTGDQVKATVTGAITNAGTVTNALSNVVVMRGTTDVTCKYNQTLNNGTLTVTPAEVVVTITGHNLTVDYDATEHTVTGYEVATTDAFFTRAHFTFNGDSILNRTLAGTDSMHLEPAQFVSTWPTPNNIGSVTFEVAADGYLTINKINATVNIAGHYDVVDYDGEQHVVNGYNTTFSTPLYTRADFEFTGDTSLTRTNAGTTNMNLAPSQFTNTNDNFDVVTFEVDADGYLTVNPIDVTVTVTGHTNTADFDGEEHVIAGYDLVFSTPLYTAADFTFSGVDTAKRTNAGTTNMGLNAAQFVNTNNNFANVTFNVTDGWQKINPIDVTVTVTGHNNTADYDGTEHVITGYDLVFSKPLYTAADFTFSGVDTAKRTDAGTTNMGLNANQFTNTNNNFSTVTFNVTDGYQTINKINATVTVTGHYAEFAYNGEEHVVSGYDLVFAPTLYTVNDFSFSGTNTLFRTNAGTDYMNLVPEQFTNLNTTNFETVTFVIAADGYLTVNKIDVEVTITGHNSTDAYDGEQHSVSGYDVNPNTPLYTAADINFTGNAYAARTHVVEGNDNDGRTDMGLTAEMFANANMTNFANVTFNVIDGYQVITPITATVTVTGHSHSDMFNGEEFVVSGFDTTYSTDLYSGTDFTFTPATGADLINGVISARRTEVGTTFMGLAPEQFANHNNDFATVTFNVTDGKQIVEPNSAQVTIIGHTRTVAYNGSEQTVTGYDVVSSNTLYGAADFTFTNGDSTATRQFVGTTSMGLNETMFHNTNPNFAGNVTFTVQDGSITVTPANAVVTIVGANNTTAYDGAQHTVTGFTPTADLTFYNVDTSFTFTPAANAVMVGDEIAAKRTDAGTTNMGLAVSQFANTNPNFNVTFNVTDGYQTITPLDVTVTITGANNTTTYDREEHSVSGYNVQVSSPLYTENDFAFNGTAYAAQTEIGTANMGLDANQFVNNNNNFNVTFDVTDGYQTITRVTGVVVTITGHNKTEHYNGSEQSVSGYEVSTNNTLYTEADFTFDGTAYAARTDTGIVWMGLEGHFANTNDNFSGVTFNVTDGFMRVTQLPVTVTVTGHSDSRYFDNAQHEVSGFDTVISSPLYTAADFTFAGNNAYASRTHVVEGNDNTGKTMMGLDVAHFTNTNANFDVTFNVTDGYQEIMPVDDVVVTIKGAQSSVFYDGEEHSVSGYAATINHPLYHESDYDFNGTAAAAQTNVGTAYMGLNASQFTNHNTDFTNVTFDVTDGHQIVEPNSAQVTIIGHTRTVTYNGEAQVVKGYDIQSSNTLYGAADFTFTNGDSTATRQFVGTTTMGLSEAMFQNTNPNFVNNVTFTVQDGSITVVPADAVVTIVGKNNTAPYDGAEHTVTGYTSTADLTFYNVDTSFTFNGTAQASRTFVGTTNMGLAVGQFTNKNPNFNVTFNVTDGYQTITPIDVTVTIVGDHNTAPYDGSVHTVTGYTATANPTIYNVDTSFTFSGPTTVSRTDAGTTNMGLTADQFANTNPNFANVTFNVTDGYQTITPINAVVTVVGNHAENVFDNAAHTVTGFTATANTNLYKTTGNNRDFTFEGQATATRTSVVEGADNSGKTMMGLTADMFANTNSNFATVTFNVTDGYQKINQAPVTVTIKGAVDSVLYLDQVEQSVHGYEVTSISNPLYTEENFSYVGDADDTVATGMAVATYYMNLSAQSFQDNGTDYCKNFAPTFNVTNGHLAILSRHVTVTIAGNADTVEYDGQSHQVNGYQVVNIDQPHYTANDFFFDGAATASRTNAGTTSMGLAAEQFHNQNANYQEVTFVVTDGFVTVTPKPIAVTVTGNNDTANYTGAAHTVTGFEYATAETLYNTDSCEYHGTQADSTATRTDAGTTPMGLTADEFVNTDDNFTVTFNVVDGYQYVVPDTVKVTITGQHNEFAFDNSEHTVSGYTFATTPAQTAYDPYAYVTFIGTTPATASRTDAGTTNMGLTAAMFSNSNSNYYVTFEVTDGYVKVNALPVTVNVEGNTGVFVYDNAGHTVSGYTVTATSDLFDVNCIQLVNGTTASVSATNANTNPYPMNLSQNSFQNTCNNSNFDVTIQVTDGWLRILGENEVYVKITGHRDTAYYDGASHTVNGYDVETVPANYTAYTFNGTATAARTNVVEGNDASGKTFMNLAVNQFSSTNNNYNVIFDVEDGYIWIKPIDTMVVTITGNTATQTYTRTEHTVTGYTSTANTTLFDANKVVFNGNSTASRTLAGTTHMGLVASQFSYNDQNFTNVTFNVHDGAMTVSKKPVSIIGDTIFHKIYDGDSLRVRYDLLTYNGFVDGDVITTGEIVTMGSHIGTYLCNQNNFMAFNDETYVAENRLFGEPSVIQNYAPAFNVTLRIDPVQELNVPDTVRIVLTEGTADTTVTTVEIGTPDNELPGTTIVNNLPDVNPLPADTTRVTWTIYDNEGNEMTHNDQVVIVVYAPCDTIEYNGYAYPAKRIGYQCWMTENLRTETYADGTTPVADYHAYMDNPANLEKFGYLYTWYSAVNVPENNNSATPAVLTAANGTSYVQGVCPEGWAVASVADYDVLYLHVGDVILLKDAGEGYWYPGNGGVLPNSGFNSRAGGLFKSMNDRYEDILTGDHYWKSDSTPNSANATSGNINYFCDAPSEVQSPKTDRKSVRCIKKR